MVWQLAKTWDETAFVGHALPELTHAMGLHLVLNDLDNYQDSDDITFVDPTVLERLRADWVARAAAFFPPEWHQTINNRVASAENFHLALVAHMDQVRFSLRAPAWVRACRALAIALAVLAVVAIVLLFEPLGLARTHATVLAAELLPVGAAAFGLAAALGREGFRGTRALSVSDNVRQELRAAIVHAFGRPISEMAVELELDSQLSLEY